MKKYALTLELIDDKQLIEAYEAHHQRVWPEIIKSITGAGILEMEIYRWENRLFMSMVASEGFSFEKKAFLDAANEKVAAWEELMWNYQQGLPGAAPGEKWVVMKKIFEL